jgi:hypothetical protein
MVGSEDGDGVIVAVSVAVGVGLAVGVTLQAHNAIARQTTTYPVFFMNRLLIADIIIISRISEY